MSVKESGELGRGLRRAFDLCAEALDLLDACGAPPQIAPHLDAAMYQIKLALRPNDASGSRAE